MKLKPVTILLVLSLSIAIISAVGIILLVLFAPYYGSFGTGLLIALLVISLIILFGDRIIIKLFSPRTTFVVEIVFIILIVMILLYKSKVETIYIETTNPYFIIIESSKGITKDDFQRSWIFNKEINIKTNENILVDPNLLKSKFLKIKEPKSWSGYKVFYGSSATQKTNIVFRAYTDTLTEELLKKIVNQKISIE